MTPRERIMLVVWSLAAWTFLFFAALALLAGCETGPTPEQVADQASQMCERSGHARGTAEHFHCAADIVGRY